MRSRTLPALAATLTVLALLGGCSTAPGAPTTSPAVAPTDGQDTVRTAGQPTSTTTTSSEPSAAPSTPSKGQGSVDPSATNLPGHSPGATLKQSSPSRPKVLPQPGTQVTEPAPKALPGGGTSIFPEHRLVGFAGYPGNPVLGPLGDGDVEDRVPEMVKFAKNWGHGRKVLPVMELIVSVVHREPQADGTFRTRAPDHYIAAWLNAARKNKAMLLLNIQPGRADFMAEVMFIEKWLKEPDVGLALDPEWAVGPTDTPGVVYGHTTGDELDNVAGYLSGIVKKNKLPEKVMVYHVLRPTIARREGDLRAHPGVVLVKSADGIGSPRQKLIQFDKVVAATKADAHMGFKLFLDEPFEKPLMTQEQVFALKPTPEYVLFE